MTNLLQDMRHGARILLRSPGFALVAVLALAIGIGANTALFSVLNTLLLQRLPYQDAERLAIVWEHNLPRDKKKNVVSPGNYLHWREMNQVFTDIAAVSPAFPTSLTGVGDPEELHVQLVSAQFFAIIGVNPALGRAFTVEEDRPRSGVVIISDRLWRTRFNGDPSILNRAITLDSQPRTVVGVMPRRFSFLDKTVDVWFPVGLPPDARTPRGRWLGVVGRLKPGVTFERADADMKRVHAELTRQFPAFNTGWTAMVVPIREQLTGEVRPALFVLLGAVAFVLLIACANVANLLLARATTRQRELAVRAALGAGRARLVRQLMAESLVLATAGGAAGLLLAWWALQLLRTAVAERLPIARLELVGIDLRVLGFTIAASLISGLIFGLIPALTSAGSSLTDALKEGGRTASAGRGTRTRSAFVVLEVALALVLLVGAGLLLRSFLRLLNVDPGFNPQQTVTMRVSLPSARYDNARSGRFFETLFDRIDGLPGVSAAGAISFLPLHGLGSATSYVVVGKPTPPMGQEPVTDVRVVTHDYFKAMGIPLLRGRLFDERRATDAVNHVVINDVMARQQWPGEDPIGKRIQVSWTGRIEDEVIGVVGDVQHASLDAQAKATIYWPYMRSPYSSMTVVVRAAEARSLVSSVIGLVREQDPDLVVADVKTMEEVVSDSVAERRLTMTLLIVFAGAALVLAAVGIYGVIAYSVTQRTQEIGIRMALGATHGRVLAMVVGQALILAGLGVALGGGGALLLTRLMSGLLFGVKPADPLTFGTVAGGLVLVAAAASYLPAWRATRVDPVVALRAE
jgi:putative ABC transport system permease protein